MLKSIKTKLTVILLALALVCFGFGIVSNTAPALAESVVTSQGFYLVEGAGVNVSGTNEDGVKALRWTGIMTKDFYDNNIVDNAFGVAVRPVYDANVEINEEDYAKLTQYFSFDQYVNEVSFTDAGEFMFAFNIRYNYVDAVQLGLAYDLQLVAVPYYVVNGEKVLVDSDVDAVRRSVTGVALYHLVNGTYAVGTSQYDRLVGYVPGWNAENNVIKTESIAATDTIVATATAITPARAYIGALDVTDFLDGNSLTISNQYASEDQTMQIIFVDANDTVEVYNYSIEYSLTLSDYDNVLLLISKVAQKTSFTKTVNSTAIS